MPKAQFSLRPDEPKRLTLEWRGIWKDMSVRLDDQEIGRIPDSKTLKAGRAFDLPDGSVLDVRLKTGFQTALEVRRNGEPLPGSGADPNVQLKLAAGIIYFVGGLNLLLGLYVELSNHTGFLRQMGIGWVSAGLGFVYCILGYLTSKRSMVALGIAVSLYLLDTGLTLVNMVQAGGRPNAGVFVRIFFLLPMFGGFGAITRLRERDALKKASDAF